MSSHRAYVNCLHCYELADSIKKSKDQLYQLRAKEPQHQARNEAMKALEKGNDLYGKYGLQYALNECVGCDFSKPALAEYLKKHDPELGKYLKQKNVGTNL
ncbi:MAG: hypothetical protein Q8R47_06075 [Nanoarchaeota archaeon]|nr:hypothetical protein [Nanoarchaeota archaeon]